MIKREHDDWIETASNIKKMRSGTVFVDISGNVMQRKRKPGEDQSLACAVYVIPRNKQDDLYTGKRTHYAACASAIVLNH